MGWADKYPEDGVVPYDAAWPARYAELAGRLAAVLGEAWELEHVGSTSIPGLPAKPVIDVAIRIPVGFTASDAAAPLAAAGWTEPEPLGDHWATFWLVDGRRHGIGHLFTAAQWGEAHVRLFADWLRRHPEDRDRYAVLKLALTRDGVWDSRYTQAKAGFVLDAVNRARAERGVPAVPGPL